MGKSWRDVIKIHPAADLFPMLPKDELQRLGEDIKRNGLKEKIVLWAPGSNEDSNEYVLLDGRNRLDAMELTGQNVLSHDPKFKLIHWLVEYKHELLKYYASLNPDAPKFKPDN